VTTIQLKFRGRDILRASGPVNRAVPDTAWTPSGKEVSYHVVLPDSQERDVAMTKSLTQQLAGVGYSPADITYLALSHYHYDHTANANQFANATWLVRREERDAMFAPKTPPVTQPSTYSALRHSKTIIIKTDEYDVFGDGSVIINSAPGHTPGHQMLYLKLAHTGPVLLSGRSLSLSRRAGIRSSAHVRV